MSHTNPKCRGPGIPEERLSIDYYTRSTPYFDVSHARDRLFGTPLLYRRSSPRRSTVDFARRQLKVVRCPTLPELNDWPRVPVLRYQMQHQLSTPSDNRYSRCLTRERQLDEASRPRFVHRWLRTAERILRFLQIRRDR